MAATEAPPRSSLLPRTSIDVGEVIGEVNDEGAAAGLPLLCLVEARRAIADTDLLDLLLAHEATTIVAPRPEAWQTRPRRGAAHSATAVLPAVLRDDS